MKNSGKKGKKKVKKALKTFLRIRQSAYHDFVDMKKPRMGTNGDEKRQKGRNRQNDTTLKMACKDGPNQGKSQAPRSTTKYETDYPPDQILPNKYTRNFDKFHLEITAKINKTVRGPTEKCKMSSNFNRTYL